MKKRYMLALAASLAMGLSLPSMASPFKQHQGMGHSSPKVQLDKMELELKLQDKQLPAWNAYKQEIESTAKARKTQTDNMRDRMKQARDTKNMDATARLDLKAEMLHAEQSRLTQVKSATQALLKELSPAQQTIFNAQMNAGERKGGRFERSGWMGQKDRAACKS